MAPQKPTMEQPFTQTRSPTPAERTAQTAIGDANEGVDELSMVIRGDGALLSLDQQSQSRLSSFAGRWSIIPTSDELLLMRRVDTSNRAQPTRIPIAGEIEAAGGLADIVALIHQNRWSGSLKVVDAPLPFSGPEAPLREVRFRQGNVKNARSNVITDRLGELLYRHGRIPRSAVRTALALTSSTRRIGEALIELGLIDPDELLGFVKTQSEEIFFTILEMRKGHYWFERSQDDGDDTGDLGLSTQKLLLDGARLCDEMDHFREQIPSSISVPRKRESGSNIVPMSETARRALEVIDGQKTVADIGRELKIGEREATRVIFGLLGSGHVEMKPELVDADTMDLPRTDTGDLIEVVIEGQVKRAKLAEDVDLESALIDPDRPRGGSR
jgi:hypothetical protein